LRKYRHALAGTVIALLNPGSLTSKDFNMLNFRSVLFPVALLSFACSESVESEDVRTSGIYPEIEVRATGNGSTRVQVRLKVGGDDSNTFLRLTGDDELEATADGQTKRLDGDGNSYRATFPVDAEGTEFTIAFNRGDADDSAPASVVTLPAPFALSLAESEASREDTDLDYSWEPEASGNIGWELKGDCIISDEGTTPDDGSNTIDAGSIRTFDSEEEESCTVDLTLTRKRNGSIDEAFTEGGSIVALQVRKDSFTSTP
jgi:hypothetical protein